MAGRSSAEVTPTTGSLAYSGVLESRDGVALTGEHDIEVQLWTAEDQGEMLCTSDERTLELVNGRFSLVLPAACQTSVRETANVFVEVILDRTLLGRTKIGAVPYAVTAERSEVAAVAETADVATVAERAHAITAQSIRSSTQCEFVDANTTDCSCNDDEVAISGGACVGPRCDAGVQLVESRRYEGDARVWRLACENEGTRVACVSHAHALCLRVGS